MQSALSPPAQQQALARPVGPSVPVPPPFMLQNQYEPVQPHWFHCKEVEHKQLWMPFSVLDSLNLEEVYNSGKQFMHHLYLTLGREKMKGIYPWLTFCECHIP